jgi:hypothetical protein
MRSLNVQPSGRSLRVVRCVTTCGHGVRNNESSDETLNLPFSWYHRELKINAFSTAGERIKCWIDVGLISAIAEALKPSNNNLDNWVRTDDEEMRV